MYVCMFVYVYKYAYMYRFTCIYMYVCPSICTSMHMCIGSRVYVCMFVYMYACVCVWLCMYVFLMVSTPAVRKIRHTQRIAPLQYACGLTREVIWLVAISCKGAHAHSRTHLHATLDRYAHMYAHKHTALFKDSNTHE